MFASQYAHLIWDKLYTVKIPDVITQNEEYLKIFGTRLSGDKKVDRMTATDYITVMIPVIKMVEYYEEGISILVPSRPDMIQMHKNINSYLDEWKTELTYSINLGSKLPKELLASLDKFSKHIYDKASAVEVIDDKIRKIKLGLTPRVAINPAIDNPTKPDYDGIMKLVKQKTRGDRF